MNDQFEMLEVVDENDNVIGLETRKKIHKKGLLHREIYIWFVTSKGEIIFQHRTKNKSTFPDKLDATVGGHIAPGMSYGDTAIRECKEETDLDLKLEDLILLSKMKKRTIDESTAMDNNAIRVDYGYLYKGSVNELKVEKEEGAGFEIWKIDDISKLSGNDRNKFIPCYLTDEFLFLFKKAKKILIK